MTPERMMPGMGGQDSAQGGSLFNTISSAGASSSPSQNPTSQAPAQTSPAEQVLQQAIPLFEGIKTFFSQFEGVADAEMQQALQALGRGLEKVASKVSASSGQMQPQMSPSGMGGGESGY